MSPAGLEPAFPASMRPQTHASDRAATGFNTPHTHTHTHTHTHIYIYIYIYIYICNFILKRCQTLLFFSIDRRNRTMRKGAGGMTMDRAKSTISAKNLSQLHTVHHKPRHGGTWNWTWPSVVRRRPVTPRYAAQPSNRRNFSPSCLIFIARMNQEHQPTNPPMKGAF